MGSDRSQAKITRDEDKKKVSINFLISFKNILSNGGASRDRTDDLIRARDALSQLSYGPTLGCVDYQKLRTK